MYRLHNLPIPSHIFFCADPFLTACVAVNGRQQSDTIALLKTDGSVINICTEEVVRALKRTKVNTAPGPHMICGCTLKHCVDQLGGMFQFFFQSSVASSTARQLWKHSTVIPLPQKSTVSTLNDLRPVAFTSLVMKALERVIKNAITAVDFQLDPLQFAYRAGRGVDDAKAFILDTMHKHLETPNTTARLLFADFSSKFNTVQPHIIAERLTTRFHLKDVSSCGSWIF